MERDLNFKKLIKMYILNAWIIIFAGIVCAGLTQFVPSEANKVELEKRVFVVFDLGEADNDENEVRKATYFDAYKGLMEGNVLKNAEVFDEAERNRLTNLSCSVSYSCYTLKLTVADDGQLEKDQEIFDKLIVESEKWMQDKFADDTINIEIFYDDVTMQEGENNFAMLAAIGFIVGVVLAAMCLFVWFVLDKKIRTEEDIAYYTGLECIGTVKRRK